MLYSYGVAFQSAGTGVFSNFSKMERYSLTNMTIQVGAHQLTKTLPSAVFPYVPIESPTIANSPYLSTGVPKISDKAFSIKQLVMIGSAKGIDPKTGLEKDYVYNIHAKLDGDLMPAAGFPCKH